MKVLHISYGVGNSSANTRLHKALLRNGIDSKILVLEKCNQKISEVYDIGDFGLKYRIYQKLAYYINILEYYLLKYVFRAQTGMPISILDFGINIEKLELVKETDIIHLHCIGGNFLSLSSLKKILNLNKKVVITLHDSWYITGGCHVLMGCDHFTDKCEKCPEVKHLRNYLKYMFNKKRNILSNSNIVVTAPSQWTYRNAINSNIVRHKLCYIIGNTLDYQIFNIIDKNLVLDKLLLKKNDNIKILFGAVNSTTTPYKGFAYLIKLLEIISREYADIAQKIELNIFGADNCSNYILEKYKYRFWGSLDDERKLALLYNYCDVYVVTSLEDSFNQTVLESCASCTPVVSFATGGINDIIQHKKTGYLAEYRNVQDLLNGLFWILNNNKNNELGIAAREYVLEQYSEKKIANKFIKTYRN